MPINYGGYSMDQLSNAVQQVESAGGKNIGPRYEAGFQKKYLDGKPQWEQAAKQYGWNRVSASYGPHQVLYPVAVELGFKGSPDQLADPEVNRQYFEKKFLRDWKAAGGDLRKTLLRYNGGGDKFYPQKVMKYLPDNATSSNTSDPMMEGFRKMSSALHALNLGPLTADEIEQVLARVDPENRTARLGSHGGTA